MLHPVTGGFPLFLRSLEISGFKSFARTTRIEFPTGITAFVGANGSGKSNVVDAVRWCLGEQSARDLRAHRAEDVIYAGSRKVMGAAEVALTFEDQSGTEPKAWSELCIARRLYRSGESEYLLNRSRARLRDVLAALHGLGIDSARHVVVTQGMADSILSASPQERRALLEQAAGLSSYRERRDEARQKLATTAQNIETIEMVLAELEPRLRLLRRQARAVQERNEASRRLRAGLIDWYASRWIELSRTLEVQGRESEDLAARRKRLLEEVGRLESRAETALERERAWYQRLETCTAAMHAAERERDAVCREVEQLERRLNAANRASQEVELQLSQLEEARDEARQRLEATARSVRVLAAERLDEEQRLATLEGELQPMQQALDQRLREMAAARAVCREDERRESELQRRQMELRSRGESARTRLLETERWLAGTEERLAAANGRLQEVEGELVTLRRREQQGVEEAKALQAQVEAERTRSARLGSARARLRASVSDRESRRVRSERTLEALDHELGPALVQSLRVAPGWERAVAAALGVWAQAQSGRGAAVTLHEYDLSELVGWRRKIENELPGRWLWADGAVEGLPSGRAQPLAATLLVESDGDAEAVWRRIGPLPAHRVSSPPLQVATRDGRIWSALGVQRIQQDDRAGRYLQVKRELQALGRTLAERQRWLAQLQAAHEESGATLAALAKELEMAHRRLRTAQRERKDGEETRERLTRQRQHLLVERQERQSALEDLQRRAGELVAELEEVERALATAAQSRAAAAACLEAAEGAAEEAKARAAEISQQAEQARGRIALLRAREAGQSDVLVAMQRDAERASKEAEAALRRRQELGSELGGLRPAQEAARARLEEVQAAQQEEHRRLEAVREERPRGSEHGPALREARGRLASVISDHERVLAQLGQAQVERDRLASALREELGIEPMDLPPEVAEPPSEGEIRRLRTRAVQYADADPSVVEECRQLEERQAHLRLHVEDLKSAAHDLNEIMAVADREMRRRFGAALTAVSEEFSRVFRIMLQGGDARLEQIDAEGGIEIRAQLPGRRARSSAAFSGGERTLIASSLLFGVLKIRPTPFCILDEVDAALDETNMDRYLAVLRDVSRSTQMIVVTHNRATMAAADVLYGLTMDDEGVSSVLSLRLDAYDAAG